MKRTAIISLGLIGSICFAIVPALAASSITLTSPANGALVSGTTPVTWSYSGFHPTADVALELSSDNGATFSQIALTDIDNGTAGNFGSAVWDPSGLPDAGYVLRVRVLINAAAVSSANVIFDATAPSANFDRELPLIVRPVEGDTISGTASDNLSGVASVGVSLTNTLTSEQISADVTCDCVGNEAIWQISTAALPAGLYRLAAVAVDNAGNSSAESTMELVVL